MDRNDLLALEQLSGLTPAELVTDHPALYELTLDRAAAAVKDALAAGLAAEPAEIRDAVRELPVDLGGTNDPRDAVLAALNHAPIPDETRERIRRSVDVLAAPLAAAARLDVPLGQQEFLQPELRQARVLLIGEVAGLSMEKTARIAEVSPDPALLTDGTLTALVDAGDLDRDEAHEVGFAAGLYQLTDGNAALVRKVLTTSLPDGNGGAPRSLPDLAAWDDTVWISLLRQVPGQPADQTPEGYAVQLRNRVARLFPTSALLSRLTPGSREQLTTDVESLPPPADTEPAELSGKLREADGVAAAPQPYGALTTLVNSYPGLGLGDILGDAGLAPASRAGRALDRIDEVHRLAHRNPDLELLHLDLSADGRAVARLDTTGLDADAAARALATVRAHQQVYALSGDVEVTRALLGAGYASAADLLRAGCGGVRAATALPAQVVEDCHARALAMMSAVTPVLGSVIDASRGDFAGLAVGNVPASVADYVRGLDGYAQLFGKQTYCRCEHCRSMLSPAAYFVDLMSFVDRQVTAEFFSGPRSGRQLSLKVRRPDLWDLALTCANTNDEVPALELVDEILENYLAVSRHHPGPFDDRVAVRGVVYRDLLAGSVASLREPFVLPLARLQVYLAHHEQSRADVARLLDRPAATVTAAELELSPREYDLVTTPDTDLALLRSVFGLPLVLDGAVVGPFDVQDMVRATGVPRTDLGRLAGTRFVAASGAAVRIIAEKRDPQSVQSDIERIHGLTVGALDRLHRLFRVWRAIGWTVTETDLAFDHAAVTTLTPSELDRVVALRRIRRRLDVSIEEACALAGTVPRTAVQDNERSLFDRLFNPPDTDAERRYPKDAVAFLHPALRDPAGAALDDPAQYRLQSACTTSTDDLLHLLGSLADPLGVDPGAADEADRGMALTVANLSLLYRHARLARLLDLKVADLFRLLRHAGTGPAHHLADADDVLAFVEFHDWWRHSGYALDDLDLIRGVRGGPADRPDAATVVGEILADVAAERGLTFTDTVFAFLPGVAEDASRAILAANPGVMVPSGDGYRLTDDFDLATPLTIPPGVPVDEPAARALLAPFHPALVLPLRLAGKLGMPVEKIRQILALLGADLSAGPLPAALHAGAAAPLVELVTDLIPLIVLFRPVAFDADALTFVRADPGVFGIADVRDVGIPAVQALSRYSGYSGVAGDTALVGGTVRYSTGDLRAVLAAYHPADGFHAADQRVLARVVGAEAGQLVLLQRILTLPADPTSALERLTRAATLADGLGVSAEALALMVSADHDRLDRAADALLAALRMRNPQSQWPQSIEPLEDIIRERRRDALTDHLVHADHPQFTSHDDVYRHFLLDVDQAGVVRTSRIVSAISSMQLYVHRCLMNLEQDRRPAGDPERTAVPPTAIDVDEWSWRKNYRVWEASRKVFLWPENYLEPELRDDKTPLFEELEAALLQRPVDEQNVLDAYATYLTGFKELADLQVVGAYHDKDPAGRSDVLHVFGVTASDPPVFYYRTVDNAHFGVTEPDRGTVWGPWRRIDVQISSRRVAPVVVGSQLHIFWVEHTTKPKSRLVGGSMDFAGYQHTLILKYSTLRLDGTWTPPQRISLYGQEVFAGDGVLNDLFVPGTRQPHFDTKEHPEPLEGYTVRGFAWDQPYPYVLGRGLNVALLGAWAWPFTADVFLRSVKPWDPEKLPVQDPGVTQELWWRRSDTGPRPLHFRMATTMGAPFYDVASKFLDVGRLQTSPVRVDETVIVAAEKALHHPPILYLEPRAELSVVNGSLEDALIDVHGDAMLLQGSVRPGPGYLIRRLGTRLGSDMLRTLYTDGVDGLLALHNQESLAEPPLPVTDTSDVAGDLQAGRIDFDGSFGVYFREIFLHVPFIIANHLSSQQQFADAQRWYHYLFDPTAAEEDTPPAPPAYGSTPPGATSWVEHEQEGGAGAVGLYCDVDTSAAGLTTTPTYLTSLGGTRDHVRATGVSAIYDPTPTGFRVYLRMADGGPPPTPDEANAMAWAVHWVAVPPGRWTGATTQGQTGWQPYEESPGVQIGVYCDVDTSAAGLTTTPTYLTSIVGINGHHELTGISAIYQATAVGFRLYLRVTDGSRVTPAIANGWGWSVHWAAVPAGPGTGNTTSGATAWQLDEVDGVRAGLYCDVDTPAPGLTATPGYLTSLDGTSYHWLLTGLSAIYDPTPTGFRVHVRSVVGPQPTPEEANERGWTIRWVAAPSLAGLRERERAQRQRDRSWRYRQFRNLGLPVLRDILTNKIAIAAYRADPFNPHVIARLRLSAYQKSVVMKYVTNLVDWGDALFAQFTAESLNEATMLYTTAAAILGDRPVEIGGCDDAGPAMTFRALNDLKLDGSDLLMEIATRLLGRHYAGREPVAGNRFAADPAVLAAARGDDPATGVGTPIRPLGWNRTHRRAFSGDSGGPVLAHVGPRVLLAAAADLGAGVASTAPVFCVPANPGLLAAWDRVEDRLTKIRNGRDLAGNVRRPALFAPEIDPRMLVRTRAAGMSLDDVLGAAAGNLPPYRFLFLIERAKSYAATVQSFGAALLSAGEKKDVAELDALRTVHQQNLLSLTTRVREWELEAENDVLAGLEKQRDVTEYRRQYYAALSEQNLIPSEQEQSRAHNTASVLQKTAGALDTLAGALHLLPELGAPTSLKFGGVQLGRSAGSFSGVLRDAAGMFEADASSAGLLAGFARRKEGWDHQVELATRELEQLKKQVDAASKRRDIARRNLDGHIAGIEQLDEIYRFFGERFSNLGLYTWLSGSLQRLYRDAYSSAYAMARLAEQAYRFERGDGTTTLLDASHWDASRAGLLAGERLLLDLQGMEQRFIDTNHRGLEIHQTLSLTQVDPAALVRLAETGSCSFALRELFFDLVYPGHYRRQITSVRLTIPCITGPYTNVGATLTLTGSWLRKEPSGERAAVPLRRSVSIATSTAQQDAGVFEFGFRDDRYMPFEGAGADSAWTLSLPSTFRPFDYRTITDIVVHVTYTALADDTRRKQLELDDVDTAGTLRHQLAREPLKRMVSLRHRHSAEFARLLHSPAGTAVTVDLTAEDFPLFLHRRTLHPTSVLLAVATTPEQPLGDLRVTVNATEPGPFTAKAFLGLPAADILPALPNDVTVGQPLRLTLRVAAAGDLGVAEPAPGDLSILDDRKVKDILLYVEYLVR